MSATAPKLTCTKKNKKNTSRENGEKEESLAYMERRLSALDKSILKDSATWAACFRRGRRVFQMNVYPIEINRRMYFRGMDRKDCDT
jgi:hypothetical protein